MKFFTIALLCAFLLSTLSFASNSEWEQVCKKSRDISFPAKDRPDPSSIMSLKKCSSMDLYYGFDSTPDPVKARQCAFVEMEHGDDFVFGGSSILMMSYANGKGVERNFDIAIKLACGIAGAPAEVKGRVQHLINLRKQKWKGDDFSLCDDITSGFMMGHCASLGQRFEDVKQKRMLGFLTAKWPDKDRIALKHLNASFELFVVERTTNEVDLSGTGRAAFQIEEESKLRRDFLSALEAFDLGKQPRHSQQEFVKADKELNAIYQKIQTMKKPEWGTVTKSGIKRTQRAWLRYRDAMVLFGRQRYPEISADSWKTWSTRNRTRMLSDFVENGT